VEAVSGPRQASPARIRAQPVDIDIVETEGLDGLVDRRLPVEPVDVDPQQPLGSQGPDDVGAQLDATVVSVRVEQTGRSAVQRMKPRKPAAATATIAVRYCSASIVRSWAGWSAHDRGRLVRDSNSIDTDLARRVLPRFFASCGAA
jgi:hypothetical protein